MSRPSTVTNGFRCLDAALFVCALMVTATRGGEPRYLSPPARSAADNPFDAALHGDSTPRSYGDQRYLGRGPRTDPPPPVVFADEPPSPFGRSDGPPDSSGGIEQAQYPLAETPADRAPDEPALLSPQTPPVTEPPSLMTLSSTGVELTSVIGSGDGLGITTFNLRPVIESPRFPGVSLRPIIGLHSLSGPTSTDLPSQIYDLSLEARMYLPIGERWLTEFAVAPGIYTDFRNMSNSLRIVTRGLGYYKWSDTLRLAVGLAYLDRQDISFLPLGGVIWTPNDQWRYELLIPRPRIAHLVWSQGEKQRWAYLAGEFGGGSWAIERADGSPDIISYRDYRLLMGMEFKRDANTNWILEAGYAFGRQLQYQSTVGNYFPSPTAIVRAGLTF